MVKAYYLGPLGGGDYHLYSPQTGKCYLAALRGKLKKGIRRRTSLQLGEWLYIQPMAGTKRWRIMEKTGVCSPDVPDLDVHDCDFEYR